MKIRGHLALMAIAIIGPAILSAGVALSMLMQAEREAAQQRVQDAAKAVAVAVDRELVAADAALKVWATSPHLESGDLAALHRQALRARVSDDATVLLFDDTGQQLINTLLPFGTTLGKRTNPERVAQVIAARHSSVSDLYIGSTTGRYIVAVDVPVHLADGRNFVASQAFFHDHFRTAFGTLKLPPTWIVGVFDSKGMTIARSHGPDEFIGKPVRKEVFEASQKNFEGALRHPTREGVQVYDAFTHSAVSGWTIAVGVPIETIEAPARKAVLVTALGIFIALSAAVAAAIVVANRISNAVSRAAQSAIALGQGGLPPAHVSGILELDELSVALNDAGTLLRHEITARTEAESARAELLASEQRARKEAEEQNKAKDQFLAMLGHELRNPLSAISGAAMVLGLSQPGSKESEHAGSVVARQSKHLGRIVDDLLDVSRVMSGKILLEREPIDLADAVRRCIATLESAGAAGRHHLVPDLEPVVVSADPTRLDQIISNLLVNALKYTPDGGRIDITVRQTAATLPCDAALTVSDSGIGISPELLPTIFEVFVQGAASLERSMGGLGLGLALVRRLVALHGGSVEAASAGEGRGSRFTVRLPCTPAVSAATTRIVRRGDIAPRRILIIDDHEDSRIMLRLRLQSEGHRVIEAADGVAGIAIALKEKPDLAIVDIGLPGLDGYELARRIRREPQGRDMILVALTGYGQSEDRQAALHAGFDLHLTKPINPESLYEALRLRR